MRNLWSTTTYLVFGALAAVALSGCNAGAGLVAQLLLDDDDSSGSPSVRFVARGDTGEGHTAQEEVAAVIVDEVLANYLCDAVRCLRVRRYGIIDDSRHLAAEGCDGTRIYYPGSMVERTAALQQQLHHIVAMRLMMQLAAIACCIPAILNAERLLSGEFWAAEDDSSANSSNPAKSSRVPVVHSTGQSRTR